MRKALDGERLRRLMQALGRAATRPGRVYLTGGATAVLTGWRPSTLDVDLVFVPEEDAVYRALPDLKNRLEVNIEIASPAHFLPELPGWTERSLYIGREGTLDFFHYDPYSQALSKLERGLEKDLRDVHAMVEAGLVEPDLLLTHLESIESHLYRYPAIDADDFRRKVETFVREHKQG